jgi:O-antigen/teichoic acid export membrane protein
LIRNQEPTSTFAEDSRDQKEMETPECLDGVKIPKFKAKIAERFNRARKSQLSRNMGASSMMALIGSVFSIISYPIYLHYLGYHAYGVWLVLSVVVSVAQLGNLGIPWALMKLVAEDHSRGDWEGVRAYINVGCGIILVLGLAFVAVVTIGRSAILHWFNLGAADAAVVYAMLPYVALLSLLALLFETLNSALGGLGRMDLASYNETLSQVLVIVFSAPLLYIGLKLWAMVLATMAAYLVTQVISFVQVRRRIPVSLSASISISRHKARRLLGTGVWILSSGAFAAFFLPFTRIMLSRFAGYEVVAVNDICYMGSMRVRNVFDAAFRPMLPELSSIQGRGRQALVERIRSVDRKGFKLIFSIAIPIFVTLILLIGPLLHVWLYRSYSPLLPNAFRITLIGAFLSLLGSSAYYMLIGLGGARDSAFSAFILFVVNAALLLIIAHVFKHVTVEQAAAVFCISSLCATVYLRTRLYVFTRSRGGQFSNAN